MFRRRYRYPGSYPESRLIRIKIALALLSLGWFVWWMSLLMPARWESGGPGGEGRTVYTYYDLVITLIGGAFFFAGAFMRGDAEWSPYLVILDLYLFALMGMWFPIFVRTGRFNVWFWRALSLPLLMPWFSVWATYTKNFGSTLGPGSFLWAIGSTMVGCAVWVVPPRIAGEPLLSWTLLRRHARGEPLLDFKPQPHRPAFPVQPDPPPDR